jgi:hypothetical protein
LGTVQIRSLDVLSVLTVVLTSGRVTLPTTF